MNKWIGLSLGGILGLSHIGLIGLVANRNQFPQLNLPISDYTSYTVEAGKDGYKINYRANDPLIMGVRKEVRKPGGFLGLRTTRVRTEEQYTMDGARHLEGREQGKLSAKAISCIKAEGGGEQTGRVVGSSIAAVATPSLSSIPFVGWVLSGAVTMMGMDQGAEIGGQMARDFSEDCEEDLK